MSEGSPMQKTPSLPGQEAFLYTYVLLRTPKNGILGWFKLISTHGTPQACLEDYKRAALTNDNCIMKWGVTGEWEIIRTPTTDTEGTIDVVKLPGEEEEFMGEKLSNAPVREIPKDAEAMSQLKDRVMIDTMKDNMRIQKDEEKKMALKKKAMEELQAELDDPSSLSSYAALHWKRLTQKSTIAELKEKMEEAQKALIKTLRELGVRKRQYPHYENQWQEQIRVIQRKTNPKHAEENPVDKPIADLGDYDDQELAQLKIEPTQDEFDRGVGVERKGIADLDGDSKGKEELTSGSGGSNGATEEDSETRKKRLEAMEADLEEQRRRVARSFAEAAEVKLGPSGKGKKGKGGKGKDKGKKGKKDKGKK
jgi:hypothetical protein